MGFASPRSWPGTHEGAGLSQTIPKLFCSLEPTAMRLPRTGRSPGTFPPGTAWLDLPRPGEATPPTLDPAITDRRAVAYPNGARKLTDQGA